MLHKALELPFIWQCFIVNPYRAICNSNRR